MRRELKATEGKSEIFGERTLLRLRCKGWQRNGKACSGRWECRARGGMERGASVEFSIREHVEAVALLNRLLSRSRNLESSSHARLEGTPIDRFLAWSPTLVTTLHVEKFRPEIIAREIAGKERTTRHDSSFDSDVERERH